MTDSSKKNRQLIKELEQLKLEYSLLKAKYEHDIILTKPLPAETTAISPQTQFEPKNKSPKRDVLISEAETLKLIQELEIYQIELELQNSELMASKEQSDSAIQKYTELYDFAPIGYFTLSKEGKILELNFSAANLLGKTRQLLINSDFSSFVSDSTKQTFNLFLEKGFKSISKETCELILTTYDNLLINVHLSGITNESREQLFLTVVDISERMQSEDKLRENELLLNKAQEIAHFGSWSLDIVANKLEWSDEIYRIFGLQPQVFGATYEAFLQVVHPEDREKVDLAFKGSIQERRDSYEIEHRIQNRQTGEIRFVYEKCSHIKGVGGKIIRSIGMVQDITEQKQSEHILSARLHLIEFSHTHSKDELQQKLLDELEKLTGSRVGFFHSVDPDQNSLLLQSWSTETLNNMCKAEGKGQHYSINEAGVWVDCVHQRKPVIHNDYLGLAHKKGLPAGHAPIIRELVVPIFRGDKIVSIVGLGNKHTNYNERDIEIVSLLADLAYDITERKRAEETLRESENKFKNAFQYSSIGMALLSPEGRWLKVNSKVCEIVGYSEAELTSKTFQDITHPDDLNTDLDNVRRMLDGEIVTYTMEKRYLHKQGDIVWVLLSVSLVKNNSGGPLYFISQIEDITNRKRIKESLRDSNDRNIALLHAIPDMMFLLDNDGVFLDYYGGIDSTFFIPPSMFLGKTIKEVLPKEVAELTFYHLLKVFETNHNQVYEYQLEMNGEIQYFETRLVLCGESKALSIVRDITKRKQAEEVLRQSEKLLRTQMIAGLGSFVMEVSSGIWKSSIVLNHILGIDDTYERTLENWVKLIHPDDKKVMVDYLFNEVLGNHFRFEQEYRIIRNNDLAIRWVYGQGEVEINPVNQELSLIGAIQDITERKVLEKEKEKLKESNLLLQSENLQAQFDRLRQQVNPHFLFNCLSTLRQMVRSKSSQSEEYILKLADLYQQILQKKEKTVIPVEEELELLNSYLFLMKLRHKEALLLDINISSGSLKHNMPIFSLQLLVENCIKHNIVSKSKPLKIRLYQKSSKSITVSNNYQPKKVINESLGLGIRNLVNRYNLLNLQDGVLIEQNQSTYSTTLRLF